MRTSLEVRTSAREVRTSPMRNGYGADKVKLFWVRAPQGPTQEGAGKLRGGSGRHP